MASCLAAAPMARSRLVGCQAARQQLLGQRLPLAIEAMLGQQALPLPLAVGAAKAMAAVAKVPQAASPRAAVAAQVTLAAPASPPQSLSQLATAAVRVALRRRGAGAVAVRWVLLLLLLPAQLQLLGVAEHQEAGAVAEEGSRLQLGLQVVGGQVGLL